MNFRPGIPRYLQIADAIRRRCAGYATRVALVAPYAPDPESWAEIARAVRGG